MSPDVGSMGVRDPGGRGAHGVGVDGTYFYVHEPIYKYMKRGVGARGREGGDALLGGVVGRGRGGGARALVDGGQGFRVQVKGDRNFRVQLGRGVGVEGGRGRRANPGVGGLRFQGAGGSWRE